jgi:proteasome lid subunit RPN8/RPN11
MKILIQLDELQKLLYYVEKAFPCEASGIILGQEFRGFTKLFFIETSNKDNTLFTFRIRDAEINKISDSIKGSEKSIVGVWHNHLIGPARLSKYDCVSAKERGDLWLIYSVKYSDINLFRWDGMSFRKLRFGIVK